jgi:CheY-like chemotaxis protein
MGSQTILIADDEPLVVATYRQILQAAGYRVIVASSGKMALALLRRQVVQCVLLDVFMPDQDGIETLLKIKDIYPRTRVIVMSGSGLRRGYNFLQAAMKLGADGTAQKPLTRSQLLALLDSHAAQPSRNP